MNITTATREEKKAYYKARQQKAEARAAARTAAWQSRWKAEADSNALCAAAARTACPGHETTLATLSHYTLARLWRRWKTQLPAALHFAATNGTDLECVCACHTCGTLIDSEQSPSLNTDGHGNLTAESTDHDSATFCPACYPDALAEVTADADEE